LERHVVVTHLSSCILTHFHEVWFEYVCIGIPNPLQNTSFASSWPIHGTMPVDKWSYKNKFLISSFLIFNNFFRGALIIRDGPNWLALPPTNSWFMITFLVTNFSLSIEIWLSIEDLKEWTVLTADSDSDYYNNV
jgi:hypothetical protein